MSRQLLISEERIDLGLGDARTPLDETRNRGCPPTLEEGSALLASVEVRLGLQETSMSAMPLLRWDGSMASIQSSLAECMAALDLLFTALRRTRDRCEELERQALDARAALVAVRAELIGTQREERNARHLALHDSLTALPNRSFFSQQLNYALVQAYTQRHALAVLYLDLDGFKSINDQYGHDVGDELLRIVAARLTRMIRAEDFVSRLGGDEFACLFAELPSREQLNSVVAKMFAAVSAPCQINDLVCAVRPSIGIAMYPDDGKTAHALLKNADTAMFSAKRRRSGHMFFDYVNQELRSGKSHD